MTLPRMHGNSFDRDYIWVSGRRKHKFIIRLDKEKYCYWFEVQKDDATVFNSMENGITFETLDEATTSVESWADIHICGKPLKKQRMSVDSKYHLLVNAAKNICEKYENMDELKELRAILLKIGEI